MKSTRLLNNLIQTSRYTRSKSAISKETLIRILIAKWSWMFALFHWQLEIQLSKNPLARFNKAVRMFSLNKQKTIPFVPENTHRLNENRKVLSMWICLWVGFTAHTSTASNWIYARTNTMFKYYSIVTSSISAQQLFFCRRPMKRNRIILLTRITAWRQICQACGNRETITRNLIQNGKNSTMKQMTSIKKELVVKAHVTNKHTKRQTKWAEKSTSNPNEN